MRLRILMLFVFVLVLPLFSPVSSTTAQSSDSFYHGVFFEYVAYMQSQEASRQPPDAAILRTHLDNLNRTINPDELEPEDLIYYYLLKHDMEWSLYMAEYSVRLDALEPAPIGRERYELILKLQFGQDISVDDVVEMSNAEYIRIEGIMNELARQIDPDAESWQEVYPDIYASHPTVEEVIPAYQRAVDALRTHVEEHGFLPSALWGRIPSLRVIRNPHPQFNIFADYAQRSNEIWVTPTDAARHCDLCILALVAGNSYPGYHLQRSLEAVAIRETTHDDDWWDLKAILDTRQLNRRSVFTFTDASSVAGWGPYSTAWTINTGYFQTPAEQLVAMRRMLDRVLTARIDAQLHAGIITPEEAIESLILTTSDRDDLAAATVNTMLRVATVHSSFYLGGQQWLSLRNTYLERNPDATEADFHADALMGPVRPIHISAIRLGIDPEEISVFVDDQYEYNFTGGTDIVTVPQDDPAHDEAEDLGETSATEADDGTVHLPAEGEWTITYLDQLVCGTNRWNYVATNPNTIRIEDDGETLILSNRDWGDVRYRRVEPSVYQLAAPPHDLRPRFSNLIRESTLTVESSTLVMGEQLDEIPNTPACQPATFRLEFAGDAADAPEDTQPAAEAETNCTVSSSSNINQRSQPSTAAAVAGALQAGQSADVIGQTTDSAGFVWWQLGEDVWVRSDVVTASGDCENVPVNQP